MGNRGVPTRRPTARPYIIYRYLQSIFDNVEIEEWWQSAETPICSVSPLAASGTPPEALGAYRDWTAKNVRSELTLWAWKHCPDPIDASVPIGWLYPMTGELEAGTWPDINVIAELREP